MGMKNKKADQRSAKPVKRKGVEMDTTTAAGGSSLLFTLGYMAFFIVIIYLVVFLPQKKREKKTREMLESLQAGSNVTTVGGILGRVVNIKDDEVTLETGAEKTQIKMKKWAIKDVERTIEA
ncbi:MAG: preprotein translocase subunit YajC [Eubacteriales bacterium]|nr:preprotein translocase subunit YajC [Eubacteriales bacterium]